MRKQPTTQNFQLTEVRRFSVIVLVCLSLAGGFMQAEAGSSQWVTLRQQADVKGKAGDYQDALQLLQQAVKAAPKPEVGLYIRIADAAAQLGQREEGLKAIDEALKLQPDLKDNAKLKQIQQQLESLQVAKQVPQTNAPAVDQKTALAVATARLTMSEAQQALKDGDNANALNLAKQARQQLLPALVDPRQKDVQAWALLGAIALVTTNTSDATYAFEAIQRLDPDYTQNGQLLNLMAMLNRMPLKRRWISNISGWHKVFTLLLEKAMRGDTGAMLKVAGVYDLGEGAPRNYGEAFKWYKMAAANGNQLAEMKLGAYYLNGYGVSKDLRKAMKWFRDAASKGDAHSMLAIGLLYYGGEGVAQNYGKAMDWWCKAATAGNTTAMYLTGRCYEAGGPSITRNYEKALKWYQRAAGKDFAPAMEGLGEMYELGKGVSQDYSQALGWYRKAAAKGNTHAMINLGAMYGSGSGVPRDQSKAFSWFREAAAKGDPEAMARLGFSYILGRGVDQSKNDGDAWLSRAAKAGNKKAQQFLSKEDKSW